MEVGPNTRDGSALEDGYGRPPKMSFCGSRDGTPTPQSDECNECTGNSNCGRAFESCAELIEQCESAARIRACSMGSGPSDHCGQATDFHA